MNCASFLLVGVVWSWTTEVLIAAPKLQVAWQQEANTVHIRLLSYAQGWFALGVSAKGIMTHSQSVAFGACGADTTSDAEAWCMKVGYAASRDVPEELESSGIRWEGADVRVSADGAHLVNFSWPIEDMRADPQKSILLDSGVVWIGAVNDKSRSLSSQHTKNGAGTTTLRFSNGTSTDTVSMVHASFNTHVAHGTIMLLSWMLLGTTNVFVSRYLKALGDVWFRAHMTIAFAIAVGSLTGAWLMFRHVASENEAHFDTAHAKTGLCVLFLLAVQSALGWASHTRFNAQRSQAPIYPDRTHWYVGRITLLLAFGTSILGVHLAGGGLGFDKWPGMLLILGVCSVFLLFLGADSRHLTGRRRGEEDASLAETLKIWLYIWMAFMILLLLGIAALLGRA